MGMHINSSFDEFIKFTEETCKAFSIWTQWRNRLVSFFMVSQNEYPDDRKLNLLVDFMLDSVYYRLGRNVVDMPCSGFDAERFIKNYGWLKETLLDDAMVALVSAGFDPSDDLSEHVASMIAEVWYEYYLIHVSGEPVLLQVEPICLYDKDAIIVHCFDVLCSIVPSGSAPYQFLVSELLCTANWSIKRRNMLVKPGTRPIEPITHIPSCLTEHVFKYASKNDLSGTED